MEFLGTWESIYNPNFNSVEFDGFRKSAGLHTFTLSVTEWCDKTNAIGIYSKRGKYGGTYAHKDIAFEFASAISPVFKLYLIKEFERLKELENQNREWDVKRILTKNNYLIHTDAIKNYILPDNDFYKNREWLKHAEEADFLNVAVFNTTAKKWRELNPELAKTSNFARSHIEADMYFENIFPALNIRFISIIENIDTTYNPFLNSFFYQFHINHFLNDQSLQLMAYF